MIYDISQGNEQVAKSCRPSRYRPSKLVGATWRYDLQAFPSASALCSYGRWKLTCGQAHPCVDAQPRSRSQARFHPSQRWQAWPASDLRARLRLEYGFNRCLVADWLSLQGRRARERSYARQRHRGARSSAPRRRRLSPRPLRQLPQHGYSLLGSYRGGLGTRRSGAGRRFVGVGCEACGEVIEARLCNIRAVSQGLSSRPFAQSFDAVVTLYMLRAS